MNPRSTNIRRHVIRSIAALAVASAAAGGLASTSHAAVILCPSPIFGDPVDTVKLDSVGMHLGTGGLVGTSAACPANLTWALGGGTVTPHLTASLYMKNSMGASARIQLMHYNVHDALLATTYGAEKLALDNDEEFSIDLGAYSNTLTYRVDTALQVKVGASWVTQATETDYLGSSTKSPDNVTITAPGQYFGTGGLVGTAPGGPGQVVWDLSGNSVRVNLTGEIYMKGSVGVNARMLISYKDVRGASLGTFPSLTKLSLSNAVNTFPINMVGNPNPLIFSVDVSLQILVGSTWTTVGNVVSASL
jgi:hypothetical protein